MNQGINSEQLYYNDDSEGEDECQQPANADEDDVFFYANIQRQRRSIPPKIRFDNGRATFF